jgi:hypothetical protein
MSSLRMVDQLPERDLARRGNANGEVFRAFSANGLMNFSGNAPLDRTRDRALPRQVANRH